MASGVKAGSPALRKALRKYPQLTLVARGAAGGHLSILGPDGDFLRLPDGRKLTVICSPRNDDVAAKELVRRLASLGIRPRR